MPTPRRWRYARLRRVLRPANRVALDGWIAAEGARLEGLVLNVGAGEDSRPFGRRTVRLDAFAPRVTVRADVARPLPFADGTFDAAICTEVLEHVPDHRLVLDELARVLRPGARLVVSVPFVYHYHPDPDDHIRLSPSGLKRELERAGFDVERAAGLGGKGVGLLLWLDSLNVVARLATRVLVVALAPLLRGNVEGGWSDWAANSVAVGRRSPHAGR